MKKEKRKSVRLNFSESELKNPELQKPIEQVQKILGHEQIDTTLRYALVNQNNVKLSHRKYIS